MHRQMLTITSNKEIAKKTFALTLTGDAVKQAQPGQFVHLKVSSGLDPLLRRPLSICDVDPGQKQLTLIYRVVGRGTSLLARQKPGEKLDVLYPLGNGFPLDVVNPGDTALLVGGGIGVPPLYYLAKHLLSKEIKPASILGFNTAAEVFYKDRFAVLGPTYLTTVDGTAGLKGLVTDAIESLPHPPDVVYACGPTPMLKAVAQRFSETPVYLSLEERMGCGIGACLGCVCQVKSASDPNAYKKVCSDGPVFAANEVIL